MSFVQLTSADTGGPIWVNPLTVIAVYSIEGGGTGLLTIAPGPAGGNGSQGAMRLLVTDDAAKTADKLSAASSQATPAPR